MTDLVILFSRGATLFLVALGLWGFGYRLVHASQVGRTMLRNLLIGAGGMLLGTISAIPVPIIWWLHILGIAGTHYGVLFFYFAIDQLLNGKPQRSTVTSLLFIATTICTLATAVLDSLRKDNLTAIIDTLPYEPTWVYFSSELLHYFVLSYLTGAICILYQRDLLHHRLNSTIYSIRRAIQMSAFAMAFLTVVAVCVTIIISAFYGDILRPSINLLYNTNKTIIFTLVLLGFVLPQRMLARFTYPLVHLLHWYRQWRETRQPASLVYLHRRMIQIVPHVHLQTTKGYFDRTALEIDDARELIWSNCDDSAHPLSPEQEATLLHTLLTTHQQLHYVGDGQPPMLEGDVEAHNRAVAKHLQRLEG